MVASEVKALAEQTAKATHEISAPAPPPGTPRPRSSPRDRRGGIPGSGRPPASARRPPAGATGRGRSGR
ncbi:hypothetical protein [Methylobacterium mesophilicum]|uniref:hypothetical protein n=1 Tax=Methylobacterium mesophilicum TaxID=39956 RepID=UPI002F2FFC26